MLTRLTEAAPRPWDEIPGAVLTGVVIGVVLLIAAIRAMFGKRRK